MLYLGATLQDPENALEIAEILSLCHIFAAVLLRVDAVRHAGSARSTALEGNGVFEEYSPALSVFENEGEVAWVLRLLLVNRAAAEPAYSALRSPSESVTLLSTLKSV